jgi:hypothetical protein
MIYLRVNILYFGMEEIIFINVVFYFDTPK